MEEEEVLFQIDIDVEEVKEGDCVKMPDYEVDYMLTKNDWEDGQIDEPEEKTTQVSSEICWNCGKGGHQLRECPMPTNRSRINQAKKLFTKNQVSNKRYHDNKFAKFRPGHHSTKLRDALGLKRDEIPRHVYMMRVLGYPPGWLAEAKITNSGIKMYNSRGKRIKEVDEEDGEILNKFMKYDVDKIVEYPGFNVPLERGAKDDCRTHGFPPMKSEHELPNFIKYLEEMSTNTDLTSDESTDDEQVAMDLSEMLPSEIIEEVRVINKRINEISSENASGDSRSVSYEEGEILVTRKISQVKPRDVVNEVAESDDTSNESSNPTMKRLDIDEAKEDGQIDSAESSRTFEGCDDTQVHQTLNGDNTSKLNAVDSAGDSGNNTTSDANTEDNVNTTLSPVNDNLKDESKKSKCSEEEIQLNEAAMSDNEHTHDTTSSRSEISQQTSQNDTRLSFHSRSQPITIPTIDNNGPSTPSPRGAVTSSSFGTPHVKHHSPFSKLPSVENFNKNISDVIDFENLPDSIGKYESMCNVISKIRSFMSSKPSKK